MHREVDAPRSFLLYEVYDDAAAYQAHLESPHFREHALEYGIPQLETRERQFDGSSSEDRTQRRERVEPEHGVEPGSIGRIGRKRSSFGWRRATRRETIVIDD